MIDKLLEIIHTKNFDKLNLDKFSLTKCTLLTSTQIKKQDITRVPEVLHGPF